MIKNPKSFEKSVANPNGLDIDEAFASIKRLQFEVIDGLKGPIFFLW